MKKGAWANIPPKTNRSDPACFSPYLYRARNQVERFFNRIKQCRRVATRYDKLAANYLEELAPASVSKDEARSAHRGLMVLLAMRRIVRRRRWRASSP